MSDLAEINLSEVIEQAMIGGDLRGLDAGQRVEYVRAVCKSIGLNHLTRPFDYIVLNGKLTLYARKDATDQLRRIYGVSVDEVTEEWKGDLLIVRTMVSDKTGRKDQGRAAVSVKGLSGENLANALMKAETKSKRRATLAICGLGFLDETEVDGIDHERPGRPDPDALPEIVPASARVVEEPDVTEAEGPSPRDLDIENIQGRIAGEHIDDDALNAALSTAFGKPIDWRGLGDNVIARLATDEGWSNVTRHLSDQ